MFSELWYLKFSPEPGVSKETTILWQLSYTLNIDMRFCGKLKSYKVRVMHILVRRMGKQGKRKTESVLFPLITWLGYRLFLSQGHKDLTPVKSCVLFFTEIACQWARRITWRMLMVYPTTTNLSSLSMYTVHSCCDDKNPPDNFVRPKWLKKPRLYSSSHSPFSHPHCIGKKWS